MRCKMGAARLFGVVFRFVIRPRLRCKMGAAKLFGVVFRFVIRQIGRMAAVASNWLFSFSEWAAWYAGRRW